jgi:glycerophosphoryl diester phosphodiesterase
MALAGLGVSFSPLTPPAQYPDLSHSDARYVVIAHRGFSAEAPENTLPAIRRAVAAHADYVEFDVQRTKDHRLVLLHDPTLARTTNVAGVFPGRQDDPVGSFTLPQVKRLDAGSWMGPGFDGTRVPTLDQVLAVVAPSHTNVMLELKNPGQYPGYEAQVARELAAHHLGASRVVVHSFYPWALHAFHRAAPAIPLSVLLKGDPGDPGRYRWAQVVEPEVGDFDQSFVDRARADGLDVFAWVSDGSRQMEQLADWGVNGVTTDRPDVARRELNSR